MTYEFKTTDIKGKPYVQVNERIKYFWSQYPAPMGQIVTKLIKDEGGICMFVANVYVEGALVATGYAQENEKSSFINKTSHIENCETSAVGRALGILGIGIDVSIATAEEVTNAIANQDVGKPEVEEKEPTIKDEVLSIVSSRFSKKKDFDEWRKDKGFDKSVKEMNDKELSSLLDALND